MSAKQNQTMWSIIYHGDEKAFDEMIDKTDINEVGRNKANYLQNAIASKQTNVAKKLIKKGIDLNNKDYEGRTALVYAVEYNNYEIAKLIVESGGIVNIIDNWGNTPLWYAAFNSKGKDYTLVELLVNAGADPKHVNNAGKTSLDIAYTFNDKKLLNILTRKK